MTMLAAELANEGSPVHIRNAAGLAVKNALSAKEAARAEEFAARWQALDAEMRAAIKGKALQTLASPEARAGMSAAQVVAAIATIELPAGLWPELISQLLAAVGNAENQRLRQAALQAIGFTCENIVSRLAFQVQGTATNLSLSEDVRQRGSFWILGNFSRARTAACEGQWDSFWHTVFYWGEQ